MPRFSRLGRAGPLGLALTAYDVWRRLPPKQRRQVLSAMRKHGPRVMAHVIQRGRAVRIARAAKRR